MSDNADRFFGIFVAALVSSFDLLVSAFFLSFELSSCRKELMAAALENGRDMK
jgi:hypothetical protein